MIPVALPSIEFVVLIFSFLMITLIWIIWTLYLCCRRLFLRQNPKIIARKWRFITVSAYVVVMAIALFTIGMIFTFQRQFTEYQRTFNTQYKPVLDASQRLGEIDMPVGTRLELEIADYKDAFRVAIFPSPVLVAGVQALRVQRYLYVAPKKQDGSISFQAQTMYVSGLGTAIHDGWRCDAKRPLEFSYPPNGGGLKFTNCTLAEGNRIEGAEVPAGSEVRSSTGTVYIDGFIDDDRWIIDLAKEAVIEIDGLTLSGPVLKLDDQLNIYQVDRAFLKYDVIFGGVSHAAGESVSYNPRALRNAYPRSWIVTAPSVQMTTGNEAHMVHERSGKVLMTSP